MAILPSGPWERAHPEPMILAKLKLYPSISRSIDLLIDLSSYRAIELSSYRSIELSSYRAIVAYRAIDLSSYLCEDSADWDSARKVATDSPASFIAILLSCLRQHFQIFSPRFFICVYLFVGDAVATPRPSGAESADAVRGLLWAAATRIDLQTLAVFTGVTVTIMIRASPRL
jgi:hypothetical protein